MENRSEILEFMIGRIGEILGVDTGSLNEQTVFSDLNMKSVNYTQLTTSLEDACDIEVPFMEFRRCASLGAAADYIVKLVNA